ncbi:hypothetical protein [Spartinivicinus ruber]|uniref:hypothetical protein n=1 Tax=Spartinivicinus ruber TaxID=2683272 RepID=UPI0013D4981A|nr:hypothetical protein [Spartinivicinus ruber]
MEINRMELTKKNLRLYEKAKQYIEYYTLAKNKKPMQLHITKEQLEAFKMNLIKFNCKPPYTINGVRLIPLIN